MKYYPFRIVGVNPATKEHAYLGGARTRDAAEKTASRYRNNKKDAIKDWGPFAVLTDAEFTAMRGLP